MNSTKPYRGRLRVADPYPGPERHRASQAVLSTAEQWARHSAYPAHRRAGMLRHPHKQTVSPSSEEFLAEVRGMPQRNLAVELLQRLMNDEIRARGKTNVVQSRKFSEMLAASLLRYQARAITTAQLIEELIDLAREMREAAS